MDINFIVALIVAAALIAVSTVWWVMRSHSAAPSPTASGCLRDKPLQEVTAAEANTVQLVEEVTSLALRHSEFDLCDNGIHLQLTCVVEFVFSVPSDLVRNNLCRPILVISGESLEARCSLGEFLWTCKSPSEWRYLHWQLRVPLDSTFQVQMELLVARQLLVDLPRPMRIQRRARAYLLQRFRYGVEGELYVNSVYALGNRFRFNLGRQRSEMTPGQVIDGLLEEIYTPGLLISIDRVIRFHFVKEGATAVTFWSQNSYQRMLIHAVCEYYGLTHTSSRTPKDYSYGVWIPRDNFIEGKSLTVTKRAEQSLTSHSVERRPKRRSVEADLPLGGGGLTLDQLPAALVALIVLQLPLKSWGALCSVCRELNDSIRNNQTLFRMLCEGMGRPEKQAHLSWKQQAQQLCKRGSEKPPFTPFGAHKWCHCDDYVPTHAAHSYQRIPI